MPKVDTIFISHAGGVDDQWTRWVEAVLEEFGFDTVVFYGVSPSGGQAAKRIHDSLDRCHICLCLFSPRYFEPGRWTGDELAAADKLHKDRVVVLLPLAIGRTQTSGLYASIEATPIYDLTERAAIRLIATELKKHGAAVSARSLLVRPHNRPYYPGVRSGHLPMRTLVAGAGVENLIAESEQLAHDITSATDVSDTHLEELMAASRALARTYNYLPPGEILRQALPPYRWALEASNSSHVGEQVSELQYVLGRLHAIMSYATLDLGNDVAASRHALAVIRCARNAVNSELEAWGRGTHSMILRFQGRNDDSVREALRGLERKAEDSLTARLHAQAALSYVELGDVSRSREHLRRSEDVVDVPPTGPEMTDGIFLFSRAKHHYYAGSAYADFGEAYAPQAVIESQDAIAAFQAGNEDEKSYSDELLAFVHLARGLYSANRLEEIPEALRDLFASDPKYRTSWHLQWLTRFVTALQSGRSRGSAVALEVAEATAQFEDELPGADGDTHG